MMGMRERERERERDIYIYKIRGRARETPKTTRQFEIVFMFCLSTDILLITFISLAPLVRSK